MPQFRHRCRHHPERPTSHPVLRYFGARLRRRLFVWFGVTIFATVMVAGLVFWGSGHHSAAHRRQEGFERFVVDQFEAVWNAPAQRRDLARRAAQDLGLVLELRGPAGERLDQFGTGECHPRHEASVGPASSSRGSIVYCVQWADGGPWGVAGLVVGAVMLWIASGFIAFRLTRPLAMLVRVTREIGEGKLDVELDPKLLGGGEFRILADAVNDMAVRIRKQLTDQRELLAAVSHEIRTPLGHLRVLLELARDRGTDPDIVRELEREIVAVDALVGQLLASSRIEFGSIERRPLDAVELALRALERADLDPTLLVSQTERAPCEADPALLLQALANLLRNAEEHGRGVDELRVEQTQTELRFVVRDRGPGFAPRDLDRVFESFERGSTRVDQRGSLGLGLSLVRRIARAHGGRAWARNLDGGAEVGMSITRMP